MSALTSLEAVGELVQSQAPSAPALERFERLMRNWRISDSLPFDWPMERWQQFHADTAAALAAQMTPAGKHFVREQLERFFAVLPLPGNGDPMEQRRALSVWIEMLANFPAGPLVRALDSVILTHKWSTAPQIAQVVEVIEKDPAALRWRAIASKLSLLRTKLHWDNADAANRAAARQRLGLPPVRGHLGVTTRK
jgi:hypothetical protein